MQLSKSKKKKLADANQLFIEGVQEHTTEYSLYCVEKALMDGRDIEAPIYNETTALQHAAFSQKTELVELLLRAGAKVDNAPDGGKTPLMLAVMYDQGTAIPIMLLDAGANINARDGSGDTTFLLAARGDTIHAARGDNIGVVKLLLERGADKDLVDFGGRGAMYKASEEVIKLIQRNSNKKETEKQRAALDKNETVAEIIKDLESDTK